MLITCLLQFFLNDMVRESYSYGNKYLIAIFQVDADLCSCCIPEIRDLQDL